MKRIHHWAAILCLALAACSTPATQEPATESKPKYLTAAELPAQFYKKLQGTIGDGRMVTMDLFRQDSLLWGQYYRQENGKPLQFAGKIAADGTITLKEANDDFIQTATFTLFMLTPNELEGEWVKAESTEHLVVSLNSTPTGVASFTMETLFEENCKMRYIDDPENTEELRESWTDTLCPYIKVKVLMVHTPSADVDERINSSIAQSVISDPKYKTIKDYVHSVQAIQEPGYEGVYQEYGLTTNDRGILCMSVWHSWDGGGAHPVETISHHNFDLSTGNAILLSDVVDPKQMAALEQFGEGVFNVAYGDVAFEREGEFHLGDNFAITTEGLMFSFPPYEMGPYTIGTADIVLPYHSIGKMLLPNGPAAKFL